MSFLRSWFHNLHGTLQVLMLTLGVTLPTLLFHLYTRTTYLWPYLIYLILSLTFLPVTEAAFAFLAAQVFTYWFFRTYYHLPSQNLLLGQLSISLLVVFPILFVRYRQREVTRLLKRIEEEQKLNISLVKYSPTGIILANSQGEIKRVNDKVCNLFGYSEEEFLGLTILRLRPLDEENAQEQHRTIWNQAGTTTVMTYLDTPVLRKDGSQFPAETVITWVEWQGELLARYTIMDISSRKEAEAEKIKSATLEEALAIRDKFLSIAAHELKTPLSTVSLYADLLEQEFITIQDRALDHVQDETLHRIAVEEEEQAKTGIAIIQRQIQVMIKLINQFLDISYMRNGQLSLVVREKIALKPFLESLVSLSQIQTGKHKLVFINGSDVIAYLDALRIEQVLVNLLNNAIKYSPDGGTITVRAWYEPDGSTSISVQDQGLGIPEEKRPFIFQRFYQAHEHVNRSGMGLGLYLSKEIMEQHDGTITFENPPEGGTIFTITLPPPKP